MTQLTSLLPISDGRRLDVDAACAALDDPSGVSRFDGVSQIHMARFEVIDTIPVGGRRMKTHVLDQPMLLFGAAFDGPVDDLLPAVAAQLGAHGSEVFECCDGFPGLEGPSFSRWILEHFCPPQLCWATRTATRQQIERALDRQQRLRSFLVQNAKLEPDARRREFTKEFR